VLNLTFSILAVTLCFIPICLYWWKKLAPEKSCLIIALFWTINGITYTPEIFHWTWYNHITNQITLYYNLIDAPIIILFFYFYFRKKFFLNLLFAFIVFEVIMITWKGFNFVSGNVIIGLGTLICLVLNIWGTSVYFRKMQHTSSEFVLVFVNAGLIFYYGLFTVVYFFNYVTFSKITLPYVTFINYFSICMATGLISFGLWKYAVSRYSEERF
jgi:hypothetical protein